MILCNYVDSQVQLIAVMSLAFFGKGFGNLGFSVVADTAPREMVGMTGGVFNAMGNTAGIITPVVIGYPNIDGAVPFVHEIGCGMEMTGEPMNLLRRTIGGHVKHANTAGGLLIALGCKRNNIYDFIEQEKLELSSSFIAIQRQ
jgi:altronate dehydratase